MHAILNGLRWLIGGCLLAAALLIGGYGLITSLGQSGGGSEDSEQRDHDD